MYCVQSSGQSRQCRPDIKREGLRKAATELLTAVEQVHRITVAANDITSDLGKVVCISSPSSRIALALPFFVVGVSPHRPFEIGGQPSSGAFSIAWGVQHCFPKSQHTLKGMMDRDDW